MDFDKIAQILRGEDRKMAMDLAMDLKTNSAGEHERPVNIPNLSMVGNGMGNGIRGSSLDPSDDEGDKTESETELDEDEHENNDEQVDAANATLTEDDEEKEGKMEADGNASDMYALDDFRNRSHCHKKCKFENEYRADEHMLCCESCDVWFHGKCLRYTEGDIANEQVWVCSENCFENLSSSNHVSLSISQRDIVVGKNKTGTFKRHIKKCELKQGVDVTVKPKKIEKKERVNQGKEMDTSKEVETEDEENKGEDELAVPWSEDLRPHFQSVVEEAPSALDTWLVGRTIMYRLSRPAGWFPAKIKKRITAVKESKSKTGTFLLSYMQKATKGLMKGEHETLLDISEYGKEGRGKWVLLHERQMPSAEPENLYCTKSCKQRDNGNALFMILCEVCNVWFHGSCLGIEDGDVKEADAWVCCQKCKYDLPESLRNSALVGSSFKKQRETGTACVAKMVLDIAKKRAVERAGRRRHRPPLSFLAIKRQGQTSGRQHPVYLQRIENEKVAAGRP